MCLYRCVGISLHKGLSRPAGHGGFLASPAVLCLALIPCPLQAQVSNRVKEEWTVGHLPLFSPTWLGHLALPATQ